MLHSPTTALTARPKFAVSADTSDMEITGEPLVRIGKVVELSGIPERTLRDAIRRGDVPAVRLGPRGNYRLRLSDVEKLLEQRSERSCAA